MPKRLDETILNLIESAQRTLKAAPMNLGGFGGEGGGIGGPPGSFIGWLPQTRVAYDETEAATLDTAPSGLNPPSGWSLVDNLNHIRYRLNILESGASIVIVDDNLGNTYLDVDTIHFSGPGVTVSNLGSGDVLVLISGVAGSGGAALTVEEYDGSPSVVNVDKIIFSGAVVTDLGNGDALVTISGISYESSYNLHLFTDATNSDITGYESLVISYPPASSASSPTATVSATDTVVEEFIADSELFQAITEQKAKVVMYFYKVGGTKDVSGHVKLYHRTSGGTETLIGSSGYSSYLPIGTLTKCTFTFDVNNTTFSTTDRLVLKAFGTPFGSGTNPTLTINLGSSTEYSAISLGVNRNPLAVAETNSNDVFRCDSPGGASLWTGTISGTPSGASVTVSAPLTGTEAVLVPTSTSQLAKMRLYNTTRGDSALISNYNTGTNVVTLTASAPAAWASGDSLTIASQTVSGGGLNWVDLEITSGPISKSALFVAIIINGSAATERLTLHPFETFASSKIKNVFTQVAAVQTDNFALVKVNSNVISCTWTGTPSYIIIREQGYLL